VKAFNGDLMARIYHESDADLNVLKGKKVAVIGFGSQGKAQALCLHDSGLDVTVGVRKDGKSWVDAKKNGLKVDTVAGAVKGADVVMVLIPDEVQGDVYTAEIAPNLKDGAALEFAHGFAITFGTIKPPKTVDVIMMAPKAPGPMERKGFLEGFGVPALIAVHQDHTGNAKSIALALAKGLGSTKAGVLETDFREEATSDLFGEQAVLCGGTVELIKAAFETLVEGGYAPEMAYFECLHELKLIVDLIYEGGIANMNYSISNNAEYGEYVTGPRIVTADTKNAMRAVLKDIQTGEYAKSFLLENQAGAPTLLSRRRLTSEHQIEQVGGKLRAMMPWIMKNKLVDQTRN